MTLTACAINCSLAASGKRESSTDAMIGLLREAFAEHYVTVGEPIRIADHDVRVALLGPGVEASHNYERTHVEALQHTAELLAEYLRHPA